MEPCRNRLLALSVAAVPTEVMVFERAMPGEALTPGGFETTLPVPETGVMVL